MTRAPSPPAARSGGFTLIEVIAALVIFAGGVLMVVRLSGALSLAIFDAGLRSELVVVTQTRVDSLSRVAYDSLPVGTRSDTITIQSRLYDSVIDVAQVTPRLREVMVTATPASGRGPSFSATTFVSDPF